MRELLTPRDEADLVEIVAAARSAHSSLAVEGRGTRARLGHAVEAERAVSLAAMTGITLYEPAELVLTARAGTPLSEIEAALAANGQELAFEPMDHSAIFGTAQRSGSIAGMVAVNASGPRRIKSGAARDHLLGFRAVNGLAQSFKSGGRVMKNVTGFDLSKVIAGSFGTLAILSEVTLKVLPRAETEETVAILGLDDVAAGRVMREASGTSLEVSSLAHLPEGGPFAGTAATLLRLEGPKVSVASRKADLAALFRDLGAVEILDEAASRALWAEIREAAPIVHRPGSLWRASVAPSDGPILVATLRANGLPLAAHFYDWAGGLVWLAFEGPAAPVAAPLRAAVGRLGGHATLVRGSEADRAAVSVFHPQPPALAALSARVKAAFDPDGLFEPGRMTGGR
jgi:glycolate oxidase FAD binding subunit